MVTTRSLTGATPRWRWPVPAAATAIAALTLLPLLVIVVRASSDGLGPALDYLLRPRIGMLLSHTLLLSVITITATAVIGVGAAWLVERTDLPGAPVWRVLLVAPLAVPAFVNAYAWMATFPSFTGLAGAAVVTTLSYFPFVYLPVTAVLRGLDRGVEDTARSLGLGSWAVFCRVVLPQLRPAALGGMLLVGLHILAEFGVLEMMRYQTFTTAILQQFAIGFSNAEGSLLACVLMTMCVGLLTLELLTRGHARLARVGGGAHKDPEPLRLGRWLPVSLGGLGGLVALALGIPVTVLARWLPAGLQETGPMEALQPLLSTLGLAGAAGAVTIAASLPAAWLLARRRGAVATAVERATYLASSLPGVVIALALVTVTVDYATPIYQTAGLLVAAYVILFLPRAMVNVRAALAQAPPELTDAARSLGSRPSGAFVRVVLPIIRPGLVTGFAMVFIATATELTATLILAPIGTSTLATEFWSSSATLDYAGAAPYAAMMVLVSAPLTLLLLRRIQRESPL